MWSCNPTSEYLPKRTERYQRSICTSMFTAALSIIAKRWKQLKCPSTDKWINKIWYIHTMKHYMALKKATTWGYYAEWNKLVIKTSILYDSTYMEVEWWLPGAGKGKVLFSGYRISVLQDEKIYGDLFHNSVNILLTLMNCTVKMINMVNFIICFLPQ